MRDARPGPPRHPLRPYWRLDPAREASAEDFARSMARARDSLLGLPELGALTACSCRHERSWGHLAIAVGCLDDRSTAAPPVAPRPPPRRAEDSDRGLGPALECGTAGAWRPYHPSPPGSSSGRGGGTGELGAGSTDEDDAGEGGTDTGLNPFATGFGHEPDSHAYADASPTPTTPAPGATTMRGAAAVPHPGFASSEMDAQGDDQDAHRAAIRPAAAPPAATPATPAVQTPTVWPPPLSAEWIAAALSRFPPPGSIGSEWGREGHQPVDADPRRPQLLDLLMMESASRAGGFRIQGADLDLLCRLAGRPPPTTIGGARTRRRPRPPLPAGRPPPHTANR